MNLTLVDVTVAMKWHRCQSLEPEVAWKPVASALPPWFALLLLLVLSLLGAASGTVWSAAMCAFALL